MNEEEARNFINEVKKEQKIEDEQHIQHIFARIHELNEEIFDLNTQYGEIKKLLEDPCYNTKSITTMIHKIKKYVFFYFLLFLIFYFFYRNSQLENQKQNEKQRLTEKLFELKHKIDQARTKMQMLKQHLIEMKN